MGVYINPSNESQEEWLAKNAVAISGPPATVDRHGPGTLPVCLVDNGPFKAAAVCYSQGELTEFSDPGDRRRKRWFIVDDMEALKKVSDISRVL